MKARAWLFVAGSATIALAGTGVASSRASALATIGPGEIRRRIVAVGVEVPKRGTALVRAQTSGIVRAVFVTEGAPVKEGQILATLEDGALLAELHRAEALRDSAAESLELLTQGARGEERAAAEAEVDATRAQWKLADDRAQRQEQLGPAAVEATVAQAHWEAELARSRLEAAIARRNLVALGAPKPEVRAARFKLLEFQAAVDVARDTFQRTRLVSPIAGTILTLRIHEGDSVIGSGGDPVAFEVANLTDTELRCEVDADDAGLVAAGQHVRVGGGGEVHGTGIVTRMSDVLERRTNGRANSPELYVRNVWVDMNWSEPSSGRGPIGKKYDVEIELPTIHAPAVVPRSAIAVRDGSTSIAVGEGMWTRTVEVKLGATDEHLVQILNVPIGTRFRTR